MSAVRPAKTPRLSPYIAREDGASGTIWLWEKKLAQICVAKIGGGTVGIKVGDLHHQ